MLTFDSRLPHGNTHDAEVSSSFILDLYFVSMLCCSEIAWSTILLSFLPTQSVSQIQIQKTSEALLPYEPP